MHANVKRTTRFVGEPQNTVPQNGETNQKFGLYRSVCCGAEIVINGGLKFPDCPNHAKLTTIWRHIPDEKAVADTAKKQSGEIVIETHIENHRLFNAASGRLKLDEWEQSHLHECEVCKGVLYVLVNQPLNRSNDAA